MTVGTKAKHLFSGGHGFLEAARSLLILKPNGLIHWPAVYVNLCYALELSLKAYIFHRGETEKTLRIIGHDLVVALDTAKRLGYIPPTDKLAELVLLLKDSHKDHSLRYLKDETIDLPEDHDFVIWIVDEHFKALAKQIPITSL